MGYAAASVEEIPVEELWERLEPYLADGAVLVDQPFQQRLGEGMIRCYLSEDRVVGFGEQMVTALLAPPEAGVQPPPPPARLYYGPDKPEFQDVRKRTETEWVPELLAVLGLSVGDLPAIWDIDLLHAEPTAAGEPQYALCEINVSSVFPIPDESVAPLAATAVRRASEARSRRPG